MESPETLDSVHRLRSSQAAVLDRRAFVERLAPFIPTQHRYSAYTQPTPLPSRLRFSLSRPSFAAMLIPRAAQARGF